MNAAADRMRFEPAWKIAAMIRDREVSPVEVVEALLERIERPAACELNAFTGVFPERALATAKKLEDDLLGGDAPGPLCGVPFSIKDLSPVERTTTAFGSPAFADNPSESNTPAYERMTAAGGVFFGKTTTPEFGNKGTTQSPLTGVTNNPWDRSRTSGGSSGGAAASVAAGLGPLAQGSDGGGSIRIPAALCGVVGLKPTAGRVPFLPEDSVYETMTHHGPLAGCVRDAALMLDAIAGPHPEDPFSLPVSPDSFADAAIRPGEGPMRVGFSPNLGLGPVEPEVAELVEAAARCFSNNLDAEVEALEIDLGATRDEMAVIWSTALGYIADDLIAPRAPSDMDPAVTELAEAASKLSAVDYYRAAVVNRDALYRKVAGVFREVDLLLTPTVATAAFPHQDWQPGPALIDGRPVDRRLGWIFTFPFNMTGSPAISIPCGFTGDGLPVGLQLVGRRVRTAGYWRRRPAMRAPITGLTVTRRSERWTRRASASCTTSAQGPGSCRRRSRSTKCSN